MSVEIEHCHDGDNVWYAAFIIAIRRTMDRFETMKAFVAVAEHHGFAAAARTLGTSPPVITRAVAALERHLGVTLFQRSTRAVSLTDDGAAFLDRARQILSDLREAEQILRGGRSVPRGQLYVTAPLMFGRMHVLPVITMLLAKHGGLNARMMLLDRNVRIVEEGIDVAVRIGALADSALRTLPIGSVQQTIVASPAYLAEHGVPDEPADLDDHHCIVGTGPRLGGTWPFGLNERTAMDVPARLTVDTVDATLAAAEAGVGIANVLSYQSAEAIAAGRLVRLLTEHTPPALPVNLIYDAGRARMPAVRAFIEAMRERAAIGAWGTSTTSD